MAQKKITDLQLRDQVTGDLSIPSDDGIQSYRVTGSQIFNYVQDRLPVRSDEISNLRLSSSVGSSALTIAVKAKDGNDATSLNPSKISFRSSTLGSSEYNQRSITGSLSLVIPSGSTMGQRSASAARIYIYLLDNGGSTELAVSLTRFSEYELASTTALSGSSNSPTVLYSTTARTDVALRMIGFIENTQATAGTWATAPSVVNLLTGSEPFKSPTRTVITSSGAQTYNTPTNPRPRFVLATVLGSGGGGGGGQTAGGSLAVGAGGGAGGLSIKMISGSALGITESCNIGVGGAGGNSSGSNGSSGGNSNFGSHATGNGGGGGVGNAITGNTVGVCLDARRGTGGTATGGDVNLNGRRGERCFIGNATNGHGGDGGGTIYGDGGLGNTAGGGGGPGINYGSGGGGGCGDGGVGRTGGSGANGLIIIDEYY